MSDPRFPIGKFSYTEPPTEEQRNDLIGQLAQAPVFLRKAVQGLSPAQIETPYRDEGWTVRQVVHHLADSHMNAYIRFKLALTEDEPTVKPYAEKLWAELPDNDNTPIEVSLSMLELLHQRFVVLLRAMTPEQWKRTFNHPQAGIMPLEKNLALYAWHGRHHIAHITELRKRMSW